MKKRLNSKALSTIVSTLLILLLVFVAIGILWSVVRTFIQSGSEEVSLGKYTLDLQIDSVAINDTNNTAYVKVQRNVGTGNFSALKFVFSDDSESESIVYNQSLLENEKLTFSFLLSKLNVSNLVTVEVIPIFTLSSGKTSTGDVKDTYYVKEGYSVRITTGNPETNTTTNTTNTSTCTDTCSSLGYTCGTQTVCDSSINCGTCSSGYICSGGSCIENTTTCTDTCSSLGYTCGTQTICGSSVSCGTCGSGYVCSSGTCAASTCSGAIDFDDVCTPGCTPQEDVDCAATLAEIDFPMKTYTDYANIVYIDPDTGSSSNDGSSPSKALSSWNDISNKHLKNENTAYVQKRGTVDEIGSLTIYIEADNIYIGSYGDVSLPRPEIRPTEYIGILFYFSYDYGYIRDLVINASGTSQMVHAIRLGAYHSSIHDSPENVGNWNTVYNVSVIHGGVAGWGYGTRIRYLSLSDVLQDGVFLQHEKYLEIGFSNITKVNQYWFNETCYPTCSQLVSAGDAIQISASNWWIHDNYIDRSDTGNKFCVIVGLSDTSLYGGILEGNTLLLPKDTAEGGAGLYITGEIHNMTVRGNTFINPHTSYSDYSLSAIYSKSSEGKVVYIYNNTFVQLGKFVGALSIIYNNTFIDLGGTAPSYGGAVNYDNVILS